MGSITYRQVATRDQLNTLVGKSSRYKDFWYQYDVETVNLLQANFSLPNGLYLFTECDSEFAGFVSCDIDWWEPGAFFLRELFVSPEYQGQRIGTTLVQRCVEHAKKNGADTLVTQTAFENVPMQTLCESLGFTQWKNPRWGEGITYKRSL